MQGNIIFLQSCKWKYPTPGALKDMVQEKIRSYDFEALTEDVKPFLIRQTDIKRVERFAIYWDQVELDY